MPYKNPQFFTKVFDPFCKSTNQCKFIIPNSPNLLFFHSFILLFSNKPVIVLPHSSYLQPFFQTIFHEDGNLWGLTKPQMYLRLQLQAAFWSGFQSVIGICTVCLYRMTKLQPFFNTCWRIEGFKAHNTQLSLNFSGERGNRNLHPLFVCRCCSFCLQL